MVAGISSTSEVATLWRYTNMHIIITLDNFIFAFSALTLLVGWQEGHPACKKTEWWGAGVWLSVWSKVQTCIWPS